MTLRAFLCLLALLPVLLAAQPQFSFEGERLEFTLVRGAGPDSLVWTVSGYFYLSNLHHEALSRVIAFPVPSNAEIGSAENLELALVEPADSMAVELLAQGASGFSFSLDLPPRSFAKLRIRYSQRISGKTAHYVLLTANSWGRPLPFCEMTLLLEPGLELEELPFPGPDLSSGEAGTLYHWQFLDFSPERDFSVRLK
ncbi:MAG: hypothetical protein K0B87_04985 [Candidatus Syntrophosphaera sp.]|nr:hypothetical protein [Candidatus Syntrophosphaera sp.]